MVLDVLAFAGRCVTNGVRKEDAKAYLPTVFNKNTLDFWKQVLVPWIRNTCVRSNIMVCIQTTKPSSIKLVCRNFNKHRSNPMIPKCGFNFTIYWNEEPDDTATGRWYLEMNRSGNNIHASKGDCFIPMEKLPINKRLLYVRTICHRRRIKIGEEFPFNILRVRTAPLNPNTSYGLKDANSNFFKNLLFGGGNGVRLDIMGRYAIGLRYDKEGQAGKRNRKMCKMSERLFDYLIMN